MIKDSNCPAKGVCPFYDKIVYTKEEINYYNDYCLKGGNGCGIKHHHDLTNKLKDQENFPREKKTWRSK